jgi:hypothetical protein
VVTRVSTRLVAFAPLLYVGGADLTREFLVLRTEVLDPIRRDIPGAVLEQLTMLTKSDPAVVASLLQTKISHLLAAHRMGSLRAEDLRFFLETVDVRPPICPTTVIRAVLATP